jgi:hypothetical protein
MNLVERYVDRDGVGRCACDSSYFSRLKWCVNYGSSTHYGLQVADNDVKNQPTNFRRHFSKRTSTVVGIIEGK